ncbi:hypothetical protein [Saccharothrix texasensis]|nr:hypothetical protein [Saccharothrix texasensis]
MTAVANSAFTASQFNAYVRDNLNETAPAKATTAGTIFVATGANAIAERAPTRGLIGTAQSTASTAYTDLTTAGPSVTVTTGAFVLVFWTAHSQNTTANGRCFMSFGISGATTQAADDTWALTMQNPTATTNVRAGGVHMFPVTPGNNTFTAKYRVDAGTGTWTNRQLFVIPL